MALNKFLEDNAAWLDQAAKQRVFDKIDEKALALSDDLRQRLIANGQARIAALSQRKADAVASYDRAIALEKTELDRLMAEKPLQPAPSQPSTPTQPSPPTRPPLGTMKPAVASKRAKKKK